jgi:hypothetical protein
MGRNAQRRRAAKRARRQTGLAWPVMPRGGPPPTQLLSGWSYDLDDCPGAPDESLLDTSRCPVDATCAGCGSRNDLHAATSAFTRSPDGYDVACTTLCTGCDGRSFLHLLRGDALEQAFANHTAHTHPDSVRR